MIELHFLYSTPALLGNRRNRLYHTMIGRPMDINEVADVMDAQDILANHNHTDAAHSPYLVAALVEWKNRGRPDPDEGKLNIVNQASDVIATVGDKPRGKRAKATESHDSDDKFEATPDPSSDDEPDF